MKIRKRPRRRDDVKRKNPFIQARRAIPVAATPASPKVSTFGRWRRRCRSYEVGQRALIVMICFLISSGCTQLPAGNVETLSRQQPTVVLIRGYLDWYSAGIDQLAMKLRDAGVPAQAFRENQWRSVRDSLWQHPRSPIVLIGFSYGADDVILIARRLSDAHQTVDLLITIDPVTPAHIPANVKHAINFYEPNGIWDTFPWLRGVPLTADAGAAVENINIRTRPDLNEPGTSHETIAGNQKVHAAIASLVGQIR